MTGLFTSPNRFLNGLAWKTLADVRADFSHADTVGKHTVFNIGGNKYRLVAAIKYKWQVLYIRNVLTHAEYDRGGWKA